MIFALKLHFAAREDCFQYHSLINSAVTEILRQPEQSGRSTPMDKREIIRHHPRKKTPQSRRFLHTSTHTQIYSSFVTPIPVFSFHVFSLLFLLLLKMFNWLTHTYSDKDPFVGKSRPPDRMSSSRLKLCEHCPSLIYWFNGVKLQLNKRSCCSVRK